jgi:hypothetical protein
VQQGECAKRTHRYGMFSVVEGRGKKAFSGSKISVVQIRKVCKKTTMKLKVNGIRLYKKGYVR